MKGVRKEWGSGKEFVGSIVRVFGLGFIKNLGYIFGFCELTNFFF